jgi:hypothetical protein
LPRWRWARYWPVASP